MRIPPTFNQPMILIIFLANCLFSLVALADKSPALEQKVFSIGSYFSDRNLTAIDQLDYIDGEVVNSDGEKVVLWGVNIAAAAAFIDKKSIDEVAEDLAAFGFNAVRFHHLDAAFEPSGIFSRGSKNKNQLEQTSTGVISNDQLDKLDYFIYALKQKGIYTNINLMSGRKFTTADGVKQAAKLREYSGQAGKPASLFDPHLIKLQKDYARKLLSHTNPYTGLAYKDDPAVAMLEVANENSLFRYWLNSSLDGGFTARKELPDYYAAQLDKLWEQWLSTSTDKVSDNDFSRSAWKTRKLSTREKLSAQVRFYQDIETQFFESMIGFLKDDIGTQALISASGHYFSLANLKAQSVSDFTSPHYYWDPAEWTNGRWNLEQFTITNRSIFDIGQDGRRYKTNPVMDIAMSSVQGTPLIITEWNHWFPSKHAYELPFILGIYGALHRWDGAMIFSYMRKPAARQRSDMIDDFFEIHANPQKLVATSVAGLIIRGGYLRPSKNTRELHLSQQDINNNVLSWGSVRRTNKNWCIKESDYLVSEVVMSFESQQRLSGDCKASKDLNIIESDTGEIVWDKAEQFITVRAPRIVGVLGNLGSASHKTRLGISASSDAKGAVFLMSLDEKSITDSKSLLLTCLSEVTNTSANFDAKYKEWGEPPSRLLPVNATIDLPVGIKYVITGFNANGELVVPEKVIDGTEDNQIDCVNGTPWLLIERRNK